MARHHSYRVTEHEVGGVPSGGIVRSTDGALFPVGAILDAGELAHLNDEALAALVELGAIKRSAAKPTVDGDDLRDAAPVDADGDTQD